LRFSGRLGLAGFRRNSAGDPLQMPVAPIENVRLRGIIYVHAEVDPRAKSNVAGKISRLSILVWANRLP